MKKNMGNTDRLLRILFAVAVGVLYLVDILPGTWTLILGILGIIFVVTSFVGSCPLYNVFGISTLNRSAKNK